MRARSIIILASLAVAAMIVGAYFSKPKAAETVAHIQTAPLSAVSNIVVQGEPAYAELARALRAQDSAFELKYDQLRQNLPEALANQLPRRPSKAELRDVISRSASILGLAASRAIVPAVEEAVQNADPIVSLSLVRTLYWSIPESPRAVRILSNYVAVTSPNKHLLGMNTAEEIWRSVPQLAPLLAPWLRLSDQAGEAARALGAMGRVSAFAVEDVAQVAEFGVAGDPPKFQPLVVGPPDYDPLTANRGDAIRALGQIGQTNERVFRAFEKALVHNDQLLRCQAADGLGFLGDKALPLLPYLLKNLDASNRLVLSHQIEAISRMGPAAKAAIPALLKYSENSAVNAVPVQPEPNRLIRWDGQAMHLPFGAAWALSQIDPDQARLRLKPLAAALTFPRLPKESLARLQPLGKDLLPLAEAQLSNIGSDSTLISILALNILRLNANSKPATAALEKALRSKIDRVRYSAAYSTFEALGATNQALAALELGLLENSSPHRGAVMSLQFLGQMKSAALPLAPKILPLLNHPDYGLRHSAGKALRAIAPQALPPVQELD